MTEDPAPWNFEVTTHRQLLLSDGHGIATYCDVNPLQDMRPECHIASGEIDSNFRVWQTLNRVCTMTSLHTSQQHLYTIRMCRYL